MLPIGRPEYRKLCDMRQAAQADANRASEKTTVLFAPTIRKYDKAADPFADLRGAAGKLFQSGSYRVSWSLHPLAAGKDAGGDVPVSLIDADIVITDYSSIVYEAYLLGKLVGFYIPDIQYYRLSPGLNADPLELCPGLVADTLEQLAAMLASWAAEPSAYPHQQLQRFVGDSFANCAEDPAGELATFAIQCAKGSTGCVR